MPFNAIKHLRCAFGYDRLFAPYVDGELDDASRQRVKEHIERCGRCRAAVEEQRFAASLVAKIVVPSLEKTAAKTAAAFRAAQIINEQTSVPRRRHFLRPLTAIATLVLVVAAFWIYNRYQNSTWQVISLAGVPTINAEGFDQQGSLAVGEVLETDQSSRAQIEVGKIGHVEVAPNSRVRLTSTKLTDQRLTLERGKLAATISAPPRIFFVDTPAAQTVDLGCAYTLEADESGNGVLRVTQGWVAFVLGGMEWKVPAGAACETRPEVGPGTPYFADASVEFQNELKKIDFDKGEEKTRIERVERLINASRPRDTLTLFYLLYRLSGDERPKVYDKLASYTPPPAGVSREDVLKLDNKTMIEYRESLEPTWLQESAPQLRRLWRWLWS